MNIKFYLFTGMVLVSTMLNAQYKVSDIPAELKKNAKAVIRESSIAFHILSPGQAQEKVHKVITVLNENGMDMAQFMVDYSSFSKISGMKITLFDENGAKIKKVKNPEILDILAFDNSSVMDVRYKFYDPKTSRMPFTIEYEYTRSIKGTFFFPDWDPIEDYNVSVEQSSYIVYLPADMEFRYLEKNLEKGVDVQMADGKTIYTWKVSSQSAIKSEWYDMPFYEYGPYVHMAPTDFEIEGFSGNSETWENFGKWVRDLNAGKDILLPETQHKILEMTKDAQNDFEKIKILYEYMQNKTRYMSIQLGIGGWQPFEASEVDKNSYGDCKALSMYMKSLLKYAGIPSHYALVYAGANAPLMVKDFPSSQFNHAFLCVPLGNDTVWLECTSQEYPCGYIGTFTDDRDVLIISDEGGKVVHTRAYQKNENIKSRNVLVQLSVDGHGLVNVKTVYRGVRYDEMRRILWSDDTDRKKIIYNKIPIPNFQLEKFNYEVVKKPVPEVYENLEIIAINYASMLGDRMMMPLNIINKIEYVPKKTAERKSDIMIRRSIMDVDSVVYVVPEGFGIDKLPDNVEFASVFGSYSAKVSQHGNNVLYTREMSMNKGVYPLGSYNDFVDFYNQVSAADGAKMVLKKL
jgi:hypothetical protein